MGVTLSFRFRKTERLHGKAFDLVFRQGRWLSGPRLKIGVYAGPSGGTPRLGVVVPGAYGHAVRRNRFKRLVREVFRLHKHILPQGLDIVVMPKKGAAQPTDFWDVKAELLQLLNRAGLRLSPGTPPEVWGGWTRKWSELGRAETGQDGRAMP